MSPCARRAHGSLTDSVCRLAAPQIKETTLLVSDISEISKKYAKKMEYLGMVRDGSEKQLASGHWTCQVVGTEREETTILPLCSRLYSDVRPARRGENRVMLEVVDTVSRHTGKRGIWVLDRGGDRGEILRPLLKRELHFLQGLDNRSKILVGDLAHQLVHKAVRALVIESTLWKRMRPRETRKNRRLRQRLSWESGRKPIQRIFGLRPEKEGLRLDRQQSALPGELGIDVRSGWRKQHLSSTPDISVQPAPRRGEESAKA